MFGGLIMECKRFVVIRGKECGEQGYFLYHHTSGLFLSLKGNLCMHGYDIMYICIVNLHNTGQATLVVCNRPGIFL